MTHDELMTRERVYMALCVLEHPTRLQQAYMVRLHETFRRHRAAFFRRPVYTRRPFGASYDVLQVACAEPLSKHDLAARIEARRPESEFTMHAIKAACRWLVQQGWLRPAGGQPLPTGQVLMLYVLTPAGEEILDDLWRVA